MTDPASLPFKTRALLYLYSTRNIVACACALLGPALLFVGAIRSYWLPITAALYAFGALAAPRQATIEAELAQSLSLDALIEQLERVIREARPHLPTEMNALLDSIRASIAEIVPRLESGAAQNELYTVRETVLRYLPETLANYVALPAAFRATRALKDGKTAKQLLGEQLAMLDQQMHEVIGNLASGDAQALLANGQFLEAKFRQRDFLLPA